MGERIKEYIGDQEDEQTIDEIQISDQQFLELFTLKTRLFR